MKKILVIGGSELQLPMIKRAKEMNYLVGVVDMNPFCIGKEYSDVFFEVSTIDVKGVVSVAKKFNPNGIVTMATDMPMRSIAAATTKLGLPGLDMKTAISSTDKGEMIKIFKERGVAHPWFYIIDSKKNLDLIKTNIVYPCIIKPTDNSGSRGVQLIENENQLDEAYLYSCSSSRSGNVIIEEYLHGKEMSVEIIVIEGEVNVLAITDKLTTGYPHFVEMGHSQPASLTRKEKNEVCELAIKAVKAIGIKNGPAHVEIMLTDDGPKMIELGARLGGDFITSDLVPLSTGIDMIKATIDIACGNKPDISPKFSKASAVRYFNSNSMDGKVFKKLNYFIDNKDIEKIMCFKKCGDKLANINSSSDRIGCVIFQSNTVIDAIEKCNRIIDSIEIVVE